MPLELRGIARGKSAKAPGPLTIGEVTASPSLRGIMLALSAPLSGGAGEGYEYSIFRGATPDFIVNEFSQIARVAAMPYVDETALRGVPYFYAVTGGDSGLGMVTAVPAGTHSWPPESSPYVTAVARPQALNIVFAGDSITYGFGVPHAGTVKLPTMPGYCITALRRHLGLGEIYGSNQGHNSHTLTDYAPGGSDYTQAFDRENPKSGVSRLRSLHPNAQLVISLMLGTNDSAIAGANNAPVDGPLSPEEYEAKLTTIIERIVTVDAPEAMIFLHAPPYYTVNSHTNLTYGPAGMAAFMGYPDAIRRLVASYQATHPEKLYLGDTRSFEYFAQNYRSEHQPQRFRGTTFYLHPSGTPGANGLIGTQSLGELHAEAIARAFV